MVIPLWVLYGTFASILWAIGYVLSEKVMRETQLSPAYLMLAIQVISLPMYLALCLYLGQLKTGFLTTIASPQIMGLLVIMALTVLGGNFLILQTVLEKNATLAALIEITYPLFTVLFAYFILKEVQIDLWTAVGGALIFAGVIVIILKNQY